MRVFVSDFNTVEGNSESNSNDGNSNSIPELELSRKSNCGSAPVYSLHTHHSVCHNDGVYDAVTNLFGTVHMNGVTVRSVK